MFKIRNFLILSLLLACLILVSADSDEASARRACNCVTIEVYKPVCGTNGVTYSNAAKLNCQNRCRGTNIKVAHQGKCRN